ncbi:MAG TPA: hypothetical protein VMR18_04715 [Candidatus Saccharimonadales bacterium]|jgi:hypothetical protein|nr:hypothetical protein [Candidatus Saccharimonadales bacterium]
MIQFNLLPDVKLKYVKARRAQHTAVAISTIATIAAVVVLLLCIFFVDVVQKRSISNLNNNITKYTAQVEKTPSLNKVLTIQNQLDSINSLEASKPAASRLFGYITQLTPLAASIGSFDLDISTNSFTIDGTADTLATVDQYVDTLKFTTYSVNGGVALPAFSSVDLSSFSINTNTQQGQPGVTYGITANFDPTIFNASKNVGLSVPSEISTRSETDQPTALFNQQSSPQTNNNKT